MKDPKSDRCPLSGNPCPYHKQIHITEAKPDGSVQELHLCNMCGGQYLAQLDTTKIQPQQAEDKGTPVPVKIGPAPQQPEPGYLPSHSQMIHEFIKFVLNPPPNFKPMKWRKTGCPDCGWTIEDIRRTAKLGCPSCWPWYRNELNIVLKNAHAGGSKHVGKVPKAWKARQEEEKRRSELEADTSLPPEGQLARLERKMKEAIKAERYEDAAVIRDAIKTLKEQFPVDGEEEGRP